MVKHQKYGTYEHFCLIIFAQGNWNEKDRQSIRSRLRDKRNEKKDLPYPLFTKLVYREEKPKYADCKLCEPIYDMLMELKGSNDGIIYQGHHYLIPEDDMEDIKDLADLILGDNKVKKFYLLYFDSFHEIKKTIIPTITLNDLKEKMTTKKCKIEVFKEIIDEKKFQSRIIYEVLKY